jgi:hypothetical protein
MQVVSGAVHAPKIHFEAPPSATVPTEMTRFIRWFNATAPGGPGRLPALARAGIAHLYFESIHPFEDGNGRIGRATSEGHWRSPWDSRRRSRSHRRCWLAGRATTPLLRPQTKGTKSQGGFPGSRASRSKRNDGRQRASSSSSKKRNSWTGFGTIEQPPG